MECLVTGGAGFIGSHLVRQLRALGMAPRILDDFSNARRTPREWRDEGCAVIEGDIRRGADLDTAMSGCEVVFHLAASATVMGCEADPDAAFAVNVAGTVNVLRAAADLGVRRVVVASSREVYGEPDALPVPEDCPLAPKNAYGASKAAAEMYCARFAAIGLEVTSLRLANVYGPGDGDRVINRFIQSAAAGLPLTVFGGSQVLDFIFVDRAVDAFVQAALRPYVPGSVNVGSGTGTTILDLAHRVLTATASRSTIALLPSRDAEVSRFVADIARAKRLLGLRCPADPLAELTHLVTG